MPYAFNSLVQAEWKEEATLFLRDGILVCGLYLIAALWLIMRFHGPRF